MKGFLLVVCSLVVLVVAIGKAEDDVGDGNEKSGEDSDEKELEGLSCEAKKGCCKDSLDCPGCCEPPYDNQCSNHKGVPLNFCEVTGTYFITRVNINPEIFNPAICISLNIAGNYPTQCQGSLIVNSKKNNTDPKTNGTIPLVTLNTSEVKFVRWSSCGHVAVQFTNFNDLPTQFSQYVEHFLFNAVIIARNDAGLAILACYAIDKAPVFLTFVFSPTPNPDQWALGELVEALVPYYTHVLNRTLYTIEYGGCYPSLTALHYDYA